MANNKMYIVTDSMRKRLRGGHSSVKIQPDTLQSWDSCGICLNKAEEPYSCPEGDVFCKECILQYILAFTKKKGKNMKNGDIGNDGHKKNSSYSKKSKHCKCPQCNKNIKWDKMKKCIFPQTTNGPQCVSCERIIAANLHANLLPCTHVICSECVNNIVKLDHKCPICNAEIPCLDDIIYLHRTCIQQIESGQIKLTKEEFIVPFG